jgi:hypothetical protein
MISRQKIQKVHTSTFEANHKCDSSPAIIISQPDAGRSLAPEAQLVRQSPAKSKVGRLTQVGLASSEAIPMDVDQHWDTMASKTGAKVRTAPSSPIFESFLFYFLGGG